MTEDQMNSEAPETAPETTTDPARQAEIDALAAELLGNAPAKKPVRKSRRVTVKDPNEIEPVAAAPEAAAPEAAAADATADADAAPAAPAKRATRATSRRGTKAAAADAAPVEAEAPEDAPAEAVAEAAEPVAADSAAPESTDGESSDGESSDGESADGESGEGSSRSRSRRGRNRSRSGNGGTGDGEAQAAPAESDEDRGGSRSRDRGRKRTGGRLGDDVEPEILPDDVLIPIAGILDVLDNYAFVRTTGYLAGITDVYVSLGQVKRYGLRKGDAVVGAIRQPREGEQQGRQKYNALLKVDAVNGLNAEASIARPEFAGFTAIRPNAPLTGAYQKGQRALVLGGPGAGKTQTILALAAEVSAAQPEAHLMVILVGPRPEEITEFRRSIKGEVVVSGLELAAEDHITVVELAVERAKRLIELGIDVIVLIDSITQLGRAYAGLASSSRSLTDDPSIALPAKRLLASARATEEGASLTIVATASAETPLDRLLATELAGVANATVQL